MYIPYLPYIYINCILNLGVRRVNSSFNIDSLFPFVGSIGSLFPIPELHIPYSLVPGPWSHGPWSHGPWSLVPWSLVPGPMVPDQNFTFMTKTLHDIERTEKVVPHLAKKQKQKHTKQINC